MTELKLNDFESFNKILFGDHEPDWSKFYDEHTDIFTPPVYKPGTLPEHQLDHYALWMVISAFCLENKPDFPFDAAHPLAKCYACRWARIREFNDGYCKDVCPLILDNNYHHCGTAYRDYGRARCREDLQMAAERVAKLEWREL